MNQQTRSYTRPFVVVVGVDGSRGSLAALATGCRLAGGRGGVVHALRVVPFDSLALLDVPLNLHEEHERLRALCYAQATGLAHLVTHVALERPERALDQLAREVGADLIIVGAGRRGTLRMLLHSSTTERLVRDAHCPVLVVHEDDEADALTTASAQMRVSWSDR